MKSIWLKNYPEGVPAEINPNAYGSVVEVLEHSCQRFRDNPAFAHMNHTLSYADLDDLTRAFAAYLQNNLGLNKGERVAIMMPNLLQYPVALFGILRAGLAVTNVNPLYTPRELKHQLNDSGAKAIVVAANFAKTLNEVLAETEVTTVIVTQIADLLPFHLPAVEHELTDAIPFPEVLNTGRDQTLQPVALGGDDLAFLQYTGGTTGVSKGAMLIHRNMVANLEQVAAMLQPVMGEGEDVLISPLPMYHIMSMTGGILFIMKSGGLSVVITDPRDLQGLMAEMNRWKPTFFLGINTLFNGLLHTEGFAEVDFSRLHLVCTGGAALQKAVADQWLKVTGTPILEGLGLTECSPAVSFNPVNLKQSREGIGVPLPSTEVSLRDDQDNEVPLGEAGELWIRGPQVMHGYWQRPEATADTITTEGWLKTGDVVTMDDEGFMKVVDRKKDMILVSGFNVYPNEIENVVGLCAGVLEAACIGVPDEHSGEAVKVFVVLKPSAELNEDAIRAHCKQHLTGYKVPKQVEFRDALPKSNVGKILRRELR